MSGTEYHLHFDNLCKKIGMFLHACWMRKLQTFFANWRGFFFLGETATHIFLLKKAYGAKGHDLAFQDIFLTLEGWISSFSPLIFHLKAYKEIRQMAWASQSCLYLCRIFLAIGKILRCIVISIKVSRVILLQGTNIFPKSATKFISFRRKILMFSKSHDVKL